MSKQLRLLGGGPFIFNKNRYVYKIQVKTESGEFFGAQMTFLAVLGPGNASNVPNRRFHGFRSKSEGGAVLLPSAPLSRAGKGRNVCLI